MSFTLLDTPRRNKVNMPQKPKQPARAPIRPTRGRGGIFSTAARRDTPIRGPSQRQIDSAGIGGAT